MIVCFQQLRDQLRVIIGHSPTVPGSACGTGARVVDRQPVLGCHVISVAISLSPGQVAVQALAWLPKRQRRMDRGRS